MRMHPLSDDCTEHSPCNDCKYHKQGIDKMLCLTECERLAAYRDTGSWEGIPEMPEAVIRTVKHVKKAIVPDNDDGIEEGLSEKQASVCVIEGCEDEVYARDLCRGHYDKWQYGSVTHPAFGNYTRKYRTKNTETPAQVRHDKSIATIKLDFRECPALQDAILEMAEKAMLPASHVVMALLSEAVRKQKEAV